MLRKRLAGNLVANVYQQVVGVAIQLGSVPLFLACWSRLQYGEWLLISSVPSYLSLGEAGFATYSASEIAILSAKSQTPEALRTLHTAWGFLLGISATLIGVGSIAVWLVPWSSVLGVSGDRREISAIIAVLGLYTILGLTTSIFDAIYRGGFRAPRSVFLVSSGRLTELVVTAICIMVSRSMLTLSLALLGVRIGMITVLFLDTRLCVPRLRLGLSSFSWAELRRIWRPSVLFLVFSIGNAAYFQGLTMVVGLRLGAAAVVLFNTTRAMTRVIVQFITLIKHSVWPEFSYLYGAGDINRARRLNQLILEVAGIACVAFGSVI